MDDTQSQNLDVLVVGAGITGLLIAQGLKKSGISCTVFESEPSASHYRPREWGMSIHWSRPLLTALLPEDLQHRLHEPLCDPSFNSDAAGGYVVPIHDGRTGQHIKDLPMPNAIRVSRRKMRAFCAQGIETQYGKTLASIDTSGDGVTAIFADGTTHQGSLIIGTDGAKSKVRELLLGVEKGSVLPIGIVLYNVNVRYPTAWQAEAVRAPHPVNHVALDPDRDGGLSIWISIQDVPDPKKPETWEFQVMPSWLGQRDTSLTDAQRLVRLKELAVGLAEPWSNALEWIPEGTAVADNGVSCWVTAPWDNKDGRITLAGDAAHPLPPHRGQGLNHCIADASKLVAALKAVNAGESTLEDAIVVYDEELVKRGADEVETSRRSALGIHSKAFLGAPVMQQGYQKGEAAK